MVLRQSESGKKPYGIFEVIHPKTGAGRAVQQKTDLHTASRLPELMTGWEPVRCALTADPKCRYFFGTGCGGLPFSTSRLPFVMLMAFSRLILSEIFR